MASRKTYNTTDWGEKLLFIETKKGEFRGYKQDFLLTSLNEVEKEFYVCTKCNGIMRNACQIGEEELLVCELCSVQGDKPQPTVKFRKKISELRVKCPLEKRGCEWKGTIAEIKTHLVVCTEFIIDCTNKCDVIMKRSELAKHCINECENREVNCQHCKAEMQYKELENHYSNCIEFPLKCPNECFKNLTRKEVELHVQNECPNTILNCTNECGIKLKRYEIQNHCEKECQNRNINCKHCEVIIQFKELYTHNKTCPEFPLLCPNECLKDLTRKELETHIGDECKNTKVECPYKEMGCKETIIRRYVEEHEKRYESEHLRMTVQYFSKNCKSQIDQSEKKWKSQIDQIEKNYKSQIDQSEKKWKSQIDQIEKNFKSQIDQSEKKWKSQIDQIEKNFKSQIDQSEKKWKSQIDQNEKNCKSHERTCELIIEKLNTENENLKINEKKLEIGLMGIENKVKELTEYVLYPVVLRDELRIEILVEYLQSHLQDNDPQVTKERPLPKRSFFYEYQYVAAIHQDRSLYKDYFQKKPKSKAKLGNIMLQPSDDQETKVEEFLVIYNNSVYYNNRNEFDIQFEYIKARELIAAIIFVRRQVGAKFKLRIQDKKNIHGSPVFESIESPLRKCTYLLAEIPKDLILEERFRNDNRSVSFTIQRKEVNNTQKEKK